MNDKIKNQIKGSLLGLVWGDVLGSPIESWNSELIQNVYHSYKELPNSYPIEKMKEVPQKLMLLRPLGLYSDDTQQCLLLLNICNKYGWNLRLWNQSLVQGNHINAWRGTGSSFKKTISNLKNRNYLAGSTSAGIGAGMRIAPIGALYAKNNQMLKKVVAESSLSTHRNIAAVSFAYSVAYVIAEIINGKSIKYIKNTLPSVLYHFENEINFKYKHFDIDNTFIHLLPLLIDEIKDLNPYEDIFEKTVINFTHCILSNNNKYSLNDPFVFLGGVHSLFKGLSASYNPHEVLSSIMDKGDDTDTVGAITGAILGAKFGYKWIPTHKIIDIKRINNYGSYLVNNSNVESLNHLLYRESKLTSFENEYINNTLKIHTSMFK